MIKLRHRIAVKQARYILLISLLMGLISTSWQTYFDLQQEQQNLQAEVERTIDLHKESAASAVYHLDAKQAEIVTHALLNNPIIYRAGLIDDFGDILSISTREPAEKNTLATIGEYFFRINSHIQTPLNIANSKGGSAQLLIYLDSTFIADNFTRRAATSLGIGLIHDIVLACLFLLFIFHYLSKPILNISNWVNQLRRSDQTPPIPYQEKDEIGDLVSSFDKLWHERKEMTDKLNDTINELSKSENFSRELMENAVDAMFLCLTDTSIVQANRQAATTLCIKQKQLAGQTFFSFSKNYTGKELKALFAGIDDTEPTTFEDIQINSQGEEFPIEARGIKLRLQEQDYILILARDISIRKEAEKQIYELAFFDTLTGLANRRLFIDRLNSSLKLHLDSHKFGAVLYLDLDRFKTINDSLGHSVGDAILCTVANLLISLLPEKCTCARFGGDEFVILIPEAGDIAETCAETAATIAKQILDALTTPFDIETHQLYCNTSIGIATFPEKNNSALDILRHADTALYRVKALGRNNFQFFDPEMQSSAQERLEIEKGLHQALDNNEFELWFQPQLCSDDTIFAAEALIRWKHPQKGIILPGSFINIAEDSGQIVEIGNWVLKQALKQLASWKQRGLPKTFKKLAINISPVQFMQVNFVDDFLKLLNEVKLPGQMIELEITENMLLNNFEIASNKMKILKRRGISFAIDDFGTGYSSLKYLRHLPLDVLKIDRSFVTGLRSSSDQAAIVEVIIATADRLDLMIIAEGVETLNERSALMELGCHCFQGYLFSKPLPAEVFFSKLTASSAVNLISTEQEL